MDTSANPIVYITGLDGAYTPSAEGLAAIAHRGTQIDASPIARMDGVALQDGRTVRLNCLLTQTHTVMSSPVAEQLGPALEDGPTGSFIKVDKGKATSVPNVFACGDGAMAEFGAHRASMV